jgi:hypothetical protein
MRDVGVTRATVASGPPLALVAITLRGENSNMRAILIAMLTVGTIGLLGASTASAAPISRDAIAAAMSGTSPVVKARIYCYRHYTYSSRRRFLHWGPC